MLGHEHPHEKQKKVARRDYILAFDTIGDGVNNYDMLKLKCKSSSVVPFGSTPSTQLSHHFGVESIIFLE